MLLVALFNLFQGTSSNSRQYAISFSDFLAAAESGNISEVNIQGNNEVSIYDLVVTLSEIFKYKKFSFSLSNSKKQKW